MESINCNAHTCPRKVPFLTSFTDEGLRLRKADLSKGAQQVRSKALFKLMGFDSKTFTCQHFVNCKSLLLIFKKIIWWTPTNFGYFITWTFRNVGFVILFVSFMCILTCFYLSLTCLLHTHAHTQRNIKIFLMSRGAFASASTAGCLAWEVGRGSSHWPVAQTFAQMPGTASAQYFLLWKGPLNESSDIQSLFCLQGESVLVEKSSAPRCQPRKSLSPPGLRAENMAYARNRQEAVLAESRLWAACQVLAISRAVRRSRAVKEGPVDFPSRRCTLMWERHRKV